MQKYSAKDFLWNNQENIRSLGANVMNITISADHRAVDGATVAILAKEIKDIIEEPVSLFL